MSHNYASKIEKALLLLILFFVAQFSYGQTLIHYWNFNNNASEAAITTPTSTLVTGASLTAIAGGISVIDFAGGTGQAFDLQNLNARNGDGPGTHLRFNDPIGGALQFALPTTGFENVIVKFASRRSGSGAGNQKWSYSVDGTTFVPFATIAPNNGNPALETLDFSAIAATDNNPNFKLKVEFEVGAGGTVGNNRFDNFTIEGTSAGGGDTTAPTVVYAPANSSTNIAVAADITITFNEAVRLANDAAIDNTNVDALVTLRLNNATGTVVPFDATISGNTITINPTSNLANNQVYYVALLPNTVEDLSGNAVLLPLQARLLPLRYRHNFKREIWLL